MKQDDFEIQFYENVLKRSPDFIEALMALGDWYTKKGLYEKGLAIDERLEKLRPADPIILYNLACSYSLVKDLNSALKVLKRAVYYGYDDFEHLESDHDLGNLLQDECFLELLHSLKKQKKSSGVT